MGWSITGPGSSGDFAELGLSALRRRQVSQAVGALSFEQDGDYLAEPLFSVGDTIEVFRPDGVRYWYGRVMALRRIGTAAGESIRYEAADPWVWLDRITYQQSWNEAEDPNDPESTLQARLRSRILLGLDPAGAKANTGAIITDVLQYAIDSGAPIQIGTIDPAQDVPIDEQRDLTCAEALRRVLRWHPDVSTWWDFSGTGFPTLHVRRRANGPLTTVSAAAAQAVGATGELLSSIELTPRHDLVVPEVVIKYEIANQTDSKTWYTTSVDASPAEANGRAFGALVATVELGGQQASYQSQFLEAASINLSAAAWWESKLPYLAGVSGLTISDEAISPTVFREVVDGSVPAWLAGTSEPAKATAVLEYSYTDADTGAEIETREKVAVNLTGTSLTTGTYFQLVSFTPAEPIPTGLAEALRAALSELHFQGTVLLGAAELSGALHPGRRLNVSGSRAEYANMEALIQAVDEDVESGATTVTLGPPEHLGPQDLVELLRVSRTRVTSYMISTRVNGEAAFASATEGGRNTRADNSSSGHEAPRKLTVAAGTGGTIGKIILDGGDSLLEGKEIKLYEEDWCDAEGVEKKVLILRSEPYDP